MKRKEEDKNAMLTKEQREKSIAKIKEYITDNFDFEISGMQSGFLIDFITDNISGYYYNKAIADSLSFMTEKTEDLYLLMKDEEE